MRSGFLCYLLLLPAPAAAQDAARVDALAGLLAAEDRRIYEPVRFEAALGSADPVVRYRAALAAGRIRDRRASGPLLALLDRPDTTSHEVAIFALGLLGDSAVANALIARLADPRPLARGAVIEAPSALAKLGTGDAQALVTGILDGTDRTIAPDRRTAMLPGLLVEGWRFGREAPVGSAIPYLTHADDAVRWRAAYLLGRTRAAAGTGALLAAAADAHPWVRQYAVRGLTRGAADSARVPGDAVRAALMRAARDPDAGTRVNALISLATWSDSTLAGALAERLTDPVPNVRLQAVIALGGTPGATARGLVEGIADDRSAPVALRREAMLALLRADSMAAVSRAADWSRADDLRLVSVALEIVGMRRGVDVSPFLGLLQHPDTGVVASAMTTLLGRSNQGDNRIVAMAAGFQDATDGRLRSAAWTVILRLAGPDDVPLLAARFAAEAAAGRRTLLGPLIAALLRIQQSGPEGQRAVATGFLASTQPPGDYLSRRTAAERWPELAAAWGEVFPAEVRYDEQGYRDLVTRYLLGGSGARPRVRITTEGRGVMELELLGDQAPLTVANFLGLVDAKWFDGGEWHRVVPNFVVQDGAGGPGRGGNGPPPIRDEFNPVRYDVPVLGMALSGPETGTSQWFINLSPQPHLDGGYTVFGRLIAGASVLEQILQGDSIESIARVERP